jgi:hypothetical protein
VDWRGVSQSDIRKEDKQRCAEAGGVAECRCVESADENEKRKMLAAPRWSALPQQ